MRAAAIRAAMCMLVLLACDRSSSTGRERSEELGAATVTMGVDPVLFKCEMVATTADLQAILGGTLTPVETPFEPPEGTARQCNYIRADGETQQPWSFDMDCRADALKTAATLMEQYTAKARALDAGTAEVAVGERGLDHHGQALIFVDDDTPCYVRVQGPSAEGRLAVAQLIAKNLTGTTAPSRSPIRKPAK